MFVIGARFLTDRTGGCRNPMVEKPFFLYVFLLSLRNGTTNGRELTRRADACKIKTCTRPTTDTKAPLI
jgi:hypothetical protein